MRELVADFGRLFGRWTLWSWKRATAVGVTLVVFVALWAGCSGGPSKAKAGPSIPRPWNTPTPSASPSATQDVSIPPAVTVIPSAPLDAVATAEAFVKAWADHGKSTANWLTNAQRYADSHLSQGLGFTDPANVPATRVTGPGSIAATGPGGKLISVPTDAGYWSVTVVQANTGWQVDGIDRAS